MSLPGPRLNLYFWRLLVPSYPPGERLEPMWHCVRVASSLFFFAPKLTYDESDG